MKRYLPALALFVFLALPVGAQQNGPAGAGASKPAGNAPAARTTAGNTPAAKPGGALRGNAPAANTPAATTPGAPAGTTPGGNAPAEATARTLTIQAPTGGEYSAYFQEAPSTLKSFTEQAQLEVPAGHDQLTLFVLDRKSGYAARKDLTPAELPGEIRVAGPDFTLLQKVRVQVTGKGDQPIAGGTVQLSDGDGNSAMRVLQPASEGVAEFDFVRKGPGQVTVTPEGGDGSATTKNVNLDLPPGQTAQLLSVSMPEVTAVVESPAGAAEAEPAPVAPAPVPSGASPQPAPDPGGQWGSTVIGFLFLILLIGGAYLYAKNRGITIDTVLHKLGVQPDVVGAGGASLAGANAAAGVPAPGPAPVPPPVVADPNQCQFCGQMKDPTGACACTVTPGAPAAVAYGASAVSGGPGGPRLVGMGGEYMGHVFPIAGPAVIGREPSNDVPLDRDSTTSRRHAQIAPDGAGGFRIQDLGSSNGTYVNGARISDGPLQPGDEVAIGGTRFRFEV